MAEIFIFWLSVLLLMHSYVLFPLILEFLSHGKKNNQVVYDLENQLPSVSVLLSVYNEASVLEQRIRNIFNTDYSGDMEVLVGSDQSSDKTLEILERLGKEFSNLEIFDFPDRRGKGVVLNDLAKHANGKILIFTDAKVLFSTGTVSELVKHFRNHSIGIVGGNITNPSVSRDGISFQESHFMNREIMIKYREGVIWGCSIGAYGACFAVRRHLFEPIPEGFAAEDFFITLKTLEKGYEVIMEPAALCFEKVPDSLREEFRRKTRIASGNFQNLRTFMAMGIRLNGLGFCFFSHKIIRWTGPLMILLALLSSALLSRESSFYLTMLSLQLFCLMIPIIDFFLKKIRIHVIPLRFVTHFYSMNLALLLGLIKYLKGVKTNVWEPTKRS